MNPTPRVMKGELIARRLLELSSVISSDFTAESASKDGPLNLWQNLDELAAGWYTVCCEFANLWTLSPRLYFIPVQDS